MIWPNKLETQLQGLTFWLPLYNYIINLSNINEDLRFTCASKFGEKTIHTFKFKIKINLAVHLGTVWSSPALPPSPVPSSCPHTPPYSPAGSCPATPTPPSPSPPPPPCPRQLSCPSLCPPPSSVSPVRMFVFT